MGKRTVYNIKTGKSVEIDAIDAREYVETGGWSFKPFEPDADIDNPAEKKPYKKVDKDEVDAGVIAKTRNRRK